MANMDTTASRRYESRAAGARVRRRRRPSGIYAMYIRAARYVRRNFVALFIAVVLGTGVAAGSVGTAMFLNYRNGSQVRDYGRELRYAEYTVQSGDTLWDIAVDMAALNPEYQDVRQYLSVLQKTNHIYGDYLRSGTTLLIPYYDSGDAQPIMAIYAKYGIANYESWLDAMD